MLDKIDIPASIFTRMEGKIVVIAFRKITHHTSPNFGNHFVRLITITDTSTQSYHIDSWKLVALLRIAELLTMHEYLLLAGSSLMRQM